MIRSSGCSEALGRPASSRDVQRRYPPVDRAQREELLARHRQHFPALPDDRCPQSAGHGTLLTLPCPRNARKPSTRRRHARSRFSNASQKASQTGRSENGSTSRKRRSRVTYATSWPNSMQRQEPTPWRSDSGADSHVTAPPPIDLRFDGQCADGMSTPVQTTKASGQTSPPGQRPRRELRPLVRTSQAQRGGLADTSQRA